MSFFELPKPSIISADSSTGSGIEFHSGSGVISRVAHREEQPAGEAPRMTSYRVGVLPSGEVLTTYDVHLPAGTASLSLYANGGDELAADFSVQAPEWSRERILAESVFSPRLQSTVVRGESGLLGCTVEPVGDRHFVEIFELYDDKSIRRLAMSLKPDEQTIIDGVRIRHRDVHLYFQTDTSGYRSGVILPFTLPFGYYAQMQEILQQQNPLELNPFDLPFSKLGASVRIVRDDIYTL